MAKPQGEREKKGERKARDLPPDDGERTVRDAATRPAKIPGNGGQTKGHDRRSGDTR
jgi:hypothetical protein